MFIPHLLTDQHIQLKIKLEIDINAREAYESSKRNQRGSDSNESNRKVFRWHKLTDAWIKSSKSLACKAIQSMRQ